MSNYKGYIYNVQDDACMCNQAANVFCLLSMYGDCVHNFYVIVSILFSYIFAFPLSLYLVRLYYLFTTSFSTQLLLEKSTNSHLICHKSICLDICMSDSCKLLLPCDHFCVHTNNKMVPETKP